MIRPGSISNSARGAAITALLIALALSACASSTRIVKIHNSQSADRRPVQNVLVVTVAKDSGQRLQTENALAAQMTKRGVKATPSYRIIDEQTELTNSTIKAAAEEHNHDSILVARIVSVESEVEKTEGRTDIVATCRKGDPYDRFLYDYKEFKYPDSVRVAQTVVLVSGLYRASDGARLWAVQSTCYAKDSLEQAWQEQSIAIANELQSDGWLP